MRAASEWASVLAGLRLRQARRFRVNACLSVGLMLVTWAAHAAPLLPFKVVTGKVGEFETTRGINTWKVNDGFLADGQLPVSAQQVYRIKAGQALALLYQSKADTQRGEKLWPSGFPTNWGKIIRKVDGKDIELKDYIGLRNDYSSNLIIPIQTDEYAISRMPKSKFNPPLAKADFDRTQGIWLFNSPDPEPFRKYYKQYHRDLNQLAGKVLTVYYLIEPRDAQPFITIEVDFTGMQPVEDADATMAKSIAAHQAKREADSDKAEQLRADRSQSQPQARSAAAAGNGEGQANSAQAKPAEEAAPKRTTESAFERAARRAAEQAAKAVTGR